MHLKIDPELYYPETALRVQGLDGDGLARARKAGQLRFKMVGKEPVYKGEWLLEWLARTEPAGGGARK